MTTHDLTRDQLHELKVHYLMFDTTEGERAISWGEIIAADEIVPDSIIHREYGGYDFGEEDFTCSMEADR